MLLGSGVEILEAIELSKNTLTNKLLQEEIEKMRSSVRKGISLGGAIQNLKIFPLYLANAISVGEKSGNLEKSLMKTTKVLDREIDKATKLLISLLEPLTILLVGAIVGFIVIAMLLPIFQINLIIH
jgi:type II secretory pathway component PulF